MAFAYGLDRGFARAGKSTAYWQQRRGFAKLSARATKTPGTTCENTIERFDFFFAHCADFFAARATASQTPEKTKVGAASTASLRLCVAAHEIPHPAKVQL